MAVSATQHLCSGVSRTQREYVAGPGQMLMSTMVVLDLIEPGLTASERRRLPHARRRWKHVFRRKTTLGYRLMDLYYTLRTMSGVPFSNYFSRDADGVPVGVASMMTGEKFARRAGAGQPD